MHRPVARLLFLFLFSALVGCERQPAAEQVFTDYLQRLSAELDQPWQPFDPSSLSQYRMPERRLRLQPLAEPRMGLFTLLLEARHCPDLQHLISERNSGLGRVMPASHLLSHDAALLQEIERCQTLLADDPDRAALSAELDALAQGKRQALPRVFWNALHSSSEFEYYLRFADQPLPAGDEPLRDPGVTALTRLAHIGQQLPAELPPEARTTDPLFDDLRRSRLGSELIHSLLLAHHSLDQATRMLRSDAAASLCPQGAVPPRARAVHRLFLSAYGRQVQPYLARIQRLGQPWQAALAALQQVPGQPPASADYLASLQGSDSALWERYQASLRAHSQAWLALLEPCGLQPGA